jgi:hypothetical protein
LPEPLIVQLINATGQPAASVPVVFRVTDNDGLLGGQPSLTVNTNAQGRAQVRWRLGARAGAGNNRVEASSAGYTGVAAFVASGVPAGVSRIVVDSGQNQTGTVGEALPLPFIAIVTDQHHNRLAGVPVTFAVRRGNGSLGGQPLLNTVSDSDGRVAAVLKLGLEEGVASNMVEATFAGNTGLPAAFEASSLAPGPANQTVISGVVLDNSNNPIPAVTMRMFRVGQGVNNGLPVQVGTPVTTNEQGQFRIQPVPVGVLKLMADGSTAQPSSGWPTLEYDMVTVSGRENTVGQPIYLPALDRVNRLCVTATTGGTLTLPQTSPGFSLTVLPAQKPGAFPLLR